MAFLKDRGGQVAISNRIFEMRMLNMFVAEESVNSSAFQYGENNKPQFVQLLSGGADKGRIENRRDRGLSGEAVRSGAESLARG